MIAVEICIGCDDDAGVRRDAAAALAGGAARVELCGQMRDEGLTPDWDLVRAARAVFARPGVMAMVRPRAGDFVYAAAEVLAMERQIEQAAASGADGVVVGALCADGAVDRAALAALVAAAKSRGLQVAFHRAFDATPDPLAALETLVELRVDRVLTSGTPWGGGGGATDGLARLRRTVECAAGRIEVAVGGGVAPDNAAALVDALPARAPRLSLHAYSGVRSGGRVAVEQVRALVRAG